MSDVSTPASDAQPDQAAVLLVTVVGRRIQASWVTAIIELTSMMPIESHVNIA